MFKRIYDSRTAALLSQHAAEGFPTSLEQLNSRSGVSALQSNTAEVYRAFFSAMREAEASAVSASDGPDFAEMTPEEFTEYMRNEREQTAKDMAAFKKVRKLMKRGKYEEAKSIRFSFESESDEVKLPFIDSEYVITRHSKFPDELLAQIRERLTPLEGALSRLLADEGGLECDYLVDWSKDRGVEEFTSYFKGVNDATKLLCAKALVDAMLGRTQECLRELVAAIHLTVSLRSIPLLMSALTVAAVTRRLVTCCEWLVNNAALAGVAAANLDTALSLLDDESWLSRAFAGEFCFGASSFKEKPTVPGVRESFKLRSPLWVPVIWVYINTAWRAADVFEHLRLRRENVLLAQLPLPERLRRLCELEAEQAALNPLYISCKRATWNYGIAMGDAVALSRVRVARTALKWLSASAKVNPSSGDEILDPFSTDSIRVVNRDAEKVFYSVGPNGNNDYGSEEIGPDLDRWGKDITFIVPSHRDST